jgi:peptide/nickel transport system substrate-binding protein
LIGALAVGAGLLGSAQQQVLIIAQGTDAVTLDAAAITDSPSATVSTHIVETLFDLRSDGTIVPHLVESYDVSADGLTWTLRLRRGVIFHDGTPLNAEAVKFNLERLVDPANAFQFAFLLRGRVAGYDVLDAHTLRIRLSAPFAPLLAHLTHSSTGIQSPAAVRSLGARYGDNPVGTGPFRFISWDKANRRIDLARFDQYWGENARLAGVRFLGVPEGTTRMALVETGQAHVAVRVPPQDIARLQANPNVIVNHTPSVRTIYIYFNNTMRPFTDVRVRQAINYAVNKEEIVEFVLGGTARVSDAPVSPGVFGYTPVGAYEYNPERARQLLREAGFPNGFETILYSPTGRYVQDIQVAEAVQSQLREVGIRARIETLEWGAYLAKTGEAADRNVVPMGLLGWGTVTGDADYGLYALFHTSQWVPAGSSRAFYSNAQVDQILDRARSTADQVVRQQLYEQAMKIIRDDAAWLFLHSESQITALRTNVQDFVIHLTERYLAHRAFLR